MLQNLLGVFLLAIAVDLCLGCSCLLSHTQEYYCQADFVLQVKVKDEEVIYRKKEVINMDPETGENITEVDRFPVSRKYTVKIRKAFKIKENEAGLSKNSTTATMHTSYYDAACGVVLRPKLKYIIAGYIYEDQLSLNLCGWVQPWLDLSKVQKRSLRSLYEKNCDCKVVNIRANGHWKKSKNEICEWDAYRDDAACYDKESACVHDKNSVTGQCKWHRNDKLKLCRKEVKRRRWEP